MREHPCHAGTPPLRPPSLAGGKPRVLPARSRGGAVPGRTPALCHELSCSPCRRRSSAVPFLHIFLPLALRRAPVCPRCRRPGRPQAAGPLLRAYPACAPVPARACLAPARFAHLIARARRRTHVSRSFRRGFFRPQPLLPCAEKQKGGPGSRLLSTCILLHFPTGQAPWWEKYENFSTLPEDGRTEKTVTHLSRCSLLRRAQTCSGYDDMRLAMRPARGVFKSDYPTGAGPAHCVASPMSIVSRATQLGILRCSGGPAS